MKQRQNISAPESATDEPGSSFLIPAVDTRRFATAAEEAAYRAGLAERVGGTGAGAAPPDFAFEPVALRYRADGLTPEKQREYVEALADTGVARVAAARIGVSEQAINRLRRRADARSFDLACAAARRFGARRLHSIAWERAIEGTIRGHYYHGELESEERVYDNRLLIHLLGSTQHLLDERDEEAAVAENWQPFVEAMEQGLPAPDLPVRSRYDWPKEEDEEPEEEALSDTIDVWEDPDGWWTLFPPPAGFDGDEEGEPGDVDYRRRLTGAELAAIEADDDARLAAFIAEQTVRRDRHFGFEGGNREEGIFSSREAELYETSAPSDGEAAAEAEQGTPPIAEPPGEDDKEAP